MFKNTPQTRALLTTKGYTLEPSVDAAIHKVNAYLGKTVEAFNKDYPDHAVDSNQDIIEFNKALRDNYLERVS